LTKPEKERKLNCKLNRLKTFYSLQEAPVEIKKTAAESNVLLGDNEQNFLEMRVRVDGAFCEFHRLIDLERVADDVGDDFFLFSHLNRY
jgi:hypothetical protein